MIDFATAREFCGFLRWRLAATHAAAWAYETPSGDQTVVEVNEKKNPLGEYTTLFVWAQPDMVFRIVDASRLREEHEGELFRGTAEECVGFLDTIAARCVPERVGRNPLWSLGDFLKYDFVADERWINDRYGQLNLALTGADGSVCGIFPHSNRHKVVGSVYPSVRSFVIAHCGDSRRFTKRQKRTQTMGEKIVRVWGIPEDDNGVVSDFDSERAAYAMVQAWQDGQAKAGRNHEWYCDIDFLVPATDDVPSGVGESRLNVVR